MRIKLISLQAMFVVLLAIFIFSANATAQVETKVTQGFNVRGNGWKKVLCSGTPVTVFAYKHKNDVYSFGIYSDDYAGIIDLKIYPFEIEEKRLKKLPKVEGKDATQKLKYYFEIACTNARKKAFSGNYKTTAPETLSLKEYPYHYLSRNTPITIIGFKVLSSIIGNYYQYAIISKEEAGIFETSPANNIVIDMPLGYLPSTDDPQVKSILDKEKSKIFAQKEAEEKARVEEQERLRAAAEAERKAIAEREAAAEVKIKEEEIAFLQSHAPAFIEIEGWNKDSANGIAVDIAFKNGVTQKVKYVYFKGFFLNAVGDKCRNEINGSVEWKCRGVGPVDSLPDSPYYIYYDHIAHWHFSNPRFYSATANTFRLSSVTIEYMNGKKTTLSGAELKKRVRYL